ncbi:MAG TPA: efflux RND transporter periplasmic adaptor subunit, partial [candidate division Zixibacteria bacterium]|nr:efflux RND transporter periplasmic adaptor subunit [candidate division Zixibacteria bacterium]
MKEIKQRQYSRHALKLLATTAASLSLAAVTHGQGPTLVVTDSVRLMEFHDQVTLVGRTEAIATSQIVSEVEGRVNSIDALEGARVAEGATLVSVDPERIRLAHMAKKAQAAQAKAEADLAVANLKRAEQLFKEAGISESQLEEKRAAATAALERFNQLSAEERRLELDLRSCKISAPFAGYTVRQLVHVGGWVGIGDPVFEMVDLSKIKVTIDLPEKYFGQVAIGGKAAVIISGDESRPITGLVTGVAPSASQTTHTFPVYVTVSNSEGRLGGGMLVRATLNLNKKFTSLAVSKDAIVRQGPLEQIYTIVEGKAAPIAVRSSSTSGAMIAIAGEGVQQGMVVVVRGNERIFPGSPVRTPDALPPAPAPDTTTATDNSGG